MRALLTRRDVTALLRIAGVVILAFNLHRAYFAWEYWGQMKRASAMQRSGLIGVEEARQSRLGFVESVWPPLAGVGLVLGAGVLSRVVMLGLPGSKGCQGCGYDLSGVKAPVCPECGMPHTTPRQA
jgi:hypothetical protein